MQLSLTTSNVSPVTVKRPLILIVDDNEDNLVLLSFAVQEFFNCSLMTAKDGETAISSAEIHQPDLVLLDILLPDLSGIEAIVRLKQNQLTKSIPIVAVTALASPEDCDRIFRAGGDGYLLKPYMLEDLEKIVNRYLRITSLV